MIGKRKRTRKLLDDEEENINVKAAQERIRQHFESEFGPLPRQASDHESSDSESNISDSEFEGFSDDDESESQAGIEIIDQVGVGQAKFDEVAKLEQRSYMSSKPPSLTSRSLKQPSEKKKKGNAEDETEAAMEAANLKNDMSLQRLLQESHLLDSSLNLTSANRRRATEIRLQALGVKKSTLGQARMPMSHRKGIDRKRELKEQKRRTEARENGIILERPNKGNVTGKVHRDRGVGRPGVGTFKGGTLRLSKSDVAGIVGRQNGSSSRGKSFRK